jgi:GTPase-associated protein 1, N-terminal domain type 2/GTPase-associated protein 1, middle domain
MVVLQHYYTSFVNRTTGSAGFQVKALSPGISTDIQATISRMIAYRIPSRADEYDISTHPVALRYTYNGPQECIFLCSQSNGSDENGRPGNFFAHTLVMEPDSFASVPPIFYWKSPFWLLRDPEQRSQLPPLPAFDVEPTLDIEQVWEFLAQGERRAQFLKLMCAVVHMQRTQRRIVIIDSADHVALWIAAVTCMLPPDYRPLLSFATYHHDPYQGQFMITGTTADSSFRATAEEYLSYFILNTQTGKISDVDPSPFATLVGENATLALYETQLLSFFADIVPRFPAPTGIDDQLDSMARYAQIHTPPRPETLTQKDIVAIESVLVGFEQQRIYTQEDLNELHRLGIILLNIFTTQQDPPPEIYTQYDRVRVILQDKKVPTDEFILSELKHFSGKILRGEEPERATTRIARLHKVYGDELFFAVFRRADYWQWLTQFLEKGQAPYLQRLWQYMGAYFQPDAQGKWVLQKSLRSIVMLVEQRRDNEERKLLEAMRDAMVGSEKAWLTLAVEDDEEWPDEALKHFYYYLVHNLPFEQRVPYRNIVQATHGDLIVYEVQCDILSYVSSGGPEQGLAILERWIRYMRRSGYETTALLTEGLIQLKDACSSSQWSHLVPAILLSTSLAPLPPQTETSLIQTMMADLSFSTFSPALLELYKRYQEYPALSAEKRTIIAGMLAMSSGQFDQELAMRIYQRMKSLDPQVYQSEVKSFITEFFKHNVSVEVHKLVVYALFSWSKYPSFWSAYRAEFIEMLTTSTETKKAVVLLSFWFEVHPRDFRQVYLPQSFFLRLPRMLNEARRIQGFPEATRAFAIYASEQRWYPLLQGQLSERRSVFTSVGQTVMSQFQKLRMGQNTDVQKKEEEGTQELEARVAKLFAGKQTRARHEQELPKLYSLQQRELFWNCYWQNFSALLTHDAELGLDLLTFWFDHAYDMFHQIPYLVQDFFLGLPVTLEEMRRERGYRDVAAQIRALRARYPKERYNWYILVETYFSSNQEKGRIMQHERQ